MEESKDNWLDLHDGNEEKSGDEGHNDARGATIFVPRVHFAIFELRIHIVHKFKLEIYTKSNRKMV